MKQSMLAQHISNAVSAIKRCDDRDIKDWLYVWKATLGAAEYAMPHGSGFDVYPKVDIEKTNERHIVISGSYHSMDEHGYYDGWRDYTIHAWAEFGWIKVNCIGGGEHRDYIEEAFSIALTTQYDREHFRPKKEAEPS